MQQATALHTQLHRSETILSKAKTWIAAPQHKTISHWFVEQLDIRPYQHILEIGYGPGNGLYEVAKKLQIGFLAGIDGSLNHFLQAARKNKKFIDDDLLHLHLGCLEQLPYPHHYFHSIYLGNMYYSWDQPQDRFMQLHSLLKSGGKMITIVQPPAAPREKDLWNEAEKIQEQYTEAGFFDVRIAFREMHAGDAISVAGYKE
ncbi:MAG TPA: class I SAM-dependent methyltransferase [Puia sp.]|nr:class I SAM-dependent methyltransferase [Puia sp.]